MSITDQALFLLDIQPSIQRRKSLEIFGSLDPEISDSIAPPAEVKEDKSILESVQTPFAVAARMGRPNYEEQAKAEALYNALRQMRAKHATKPSHRVIRGS